MNSIAKEKENKSGRINTMMQQYMETKKNIRTAFYFIVLGIFADVFGRRTDSVKRAETLKPGKNCSLEERAPMCRVPYHTVDSYLSLLVEKGYKICHLLEQVEDQSRQKGIVKRGYRGSSLREPTSIP